MLGGLLLVSEFIDFMISSKDISAFTKIRVFIRVFISVQSVPHRAKMVKNGPKTWFFDFISFVWNLCKIKVLMVY